MSDTTTDRKSGFGVVGVGLAACVACCAPLVLSLLAGLGLAGLAAPLLFGSVGLVVTAAVVVAVLVNRSRAARSVPSCPADGSCGCG